MPSPKAGREADGTGVCGSTGRTPSAAGVGGTGVLATFGGEGIGRVAFAPDPLSEPEEEWAGDRCGDLSTYPLLALAGDNLGRRQDRWFEQTLWCVQGSALTNLMANLEQWVSAQRGAWLTSWADAILDPEIQRSKTANKQMIKNDKVGEKPDRISGL